MSGMGQPPRKQPKTNIQLAQFPFQKALEEFDVSYLENAPKTQIHHLASCDFIQGKQDLVMIGNPRIKKATYPLH